MKPVEVVGGGLAGLALGCGLRRLGVPVTLRERGTYPRHRTCGEFIHGADPEVLQAIGIAGLLDQAPRRWSVRWHHAGAPGRQWTLARPAIVVSRFELDARLAARFQALGGHLEVGQRVDLAETPDGRVFANGRHSETTSPWLGLKCHVTGLPLASDLEFHVGRRAYLGLSALDNERVNLCGIFHRDLAGAGHGLEAVVARLAASGLPALADRLAGATAVAGSPCAVAGLRFGLQPAVPGAVAIGDAFAFTPPFTGRGMGLAFASAASALGPLAAWSGGAASWEATRHAIRERQARLHRRGLGRACMLHRFLLAPRAARLAALLLQGGMLSLRHLTAYLNPPHPRACFSTP